MTQRRCLRLNLPECPYRYEMMNQRPPFDKQLYCQSIPCTFRIELLLEDIGHDVQNGK